MNIGSQISSEPQIPPESGLSLVKLARHVVADARGLADAFDPDEARNDPSLQQIGRAFVTLEEAGQLRGCIGFMESNDPLYLVVERAAYGAAFQDPRFPPLKAEELPSIAFEVSVLTRPVEDPGPRENLPERIQIGRDGLIVELDGRRGLLLPQVPVEWGWEPVQFLAQTCMKAGLPSNSWRKAACKVWTFHSIVFQEKGP